VKKKKKEAGWLGGRRGGGLFEISGIDSVVALCTFRRVNLRFANKSHRPRRRKKRDMRERERERKREGGEREREGRGGGREREE